MIPVTRSIAIPEDEIHETFVRASGPGGQNVNKVSTAVELRFDAAATRAFGPALLERLRTLAGRRMTGEGVIVIEAQRFRSRERNRADALDRLVALIREAAVVPKIRRATRPTLASKTRRLEGKSVRSRVKAGRSRPDGGE